MHSSRMRSTRFSGRLYWLGGGGGLSASGSGGLPLGWGGVSASGSGGVSGSRGVSASGLGSVYHNPFHHHPVSRMTDR